MGTFTVKKLFRVHYLVAREDERIDLTHWHLDDKGIIVSVKKDGERIPYGEDPAYYKHIDNFLGVHLDLEEEAERFAEQSYEKYQSLSAKLESIEKLVAEATDFQTLQDAKVELADFNDGMKKINLAQEHYENLKRRACNIAKEIYQKWLRLKQQWEQSCQKSFEEMKEKILGLREQITPTGDYYFLRELHETLQEEIQTADLFDRHRKECLDQLDETLNPLKQQIREIEDVNFSIHSGFVQDLENRAPHENPRKLTNETHKVWDHIKKTRYLRDEQKDKLFPRLREVFDLLKE